MNTITNLLGLFKRVLKTETAIEKGLRELNKNVRKLMAGQQELIEKLNEAKAALDLANGKLVETNTQAEKVGKETAALVLKVKELTDALNNQGNSQEVLTALAGVTEAVAAVNTTTETLKATIAGVDAQVDDAPPAPPAP